MYYRLLWLLTLGFLLCCIIFIGCPSQHSSSHRKSLKSLRSLKGGEKERKIEISDAELREVAEEVVAGLVESEPVRHAQKIPIIAFLHLKNATGENIDLARIRSKLIIALSRSREILFVEREKFEELLQGENVSFREAKKISKDLGADYLVKGKLTALQKDRILQTPTIFKLSLQLIDIDTGRIRWRGEYELKKTF
jgi:TolB-like protein